MPVRQASFLLGLVAREVQRQEDLGQKAIVVATQDDSLLVVTDDPAIRERLLSAIRYVDLGPTKVYDHEGHRKPHQPN